MSGVLNIEPKLVTQHRSNKGKNKGIHLSNYISTTEQEQIGLLARLRIEI